MSKRARCRPAPVKEKTVPIGQQTPIVKVDEIYSDNGLKTIKKQVSSKRVPPCSLHEATEALNPQMPSFHESMPEQAKTGHWTRLFMVFAVFIGSWLLYVTLISLVEVWKSSIWLAIPLIIITVTFIIFIVAFVLRERRAIQSVDKIRETRLKLKQCIQQDSIIGVHETLKPVLASIKVHYPLEYGQFDEAWKDRRTVQEYLLLLDNVLLSGLDKDVNNAINKASLSVAGLVAISPHPALDAAIVLFRANMLIRKIAGIYGLEPTGLSSLYLFKHLILSAIIAAGIEEVGVGLTENVTKVVAEGIVSAGRMYRLGKLTKKLTRPVPQKI